MQVWLLVHIVKTSGVYLIKTKKTYYVCMAWVIFLCWCAGAIWTGADDGIHFARPFGPFIALGEECIYQPQEGPPKGNVMVGIAWISWICRWRVLLMAPLINWLTKNNFLNCADISNVIRPIITSSPRQPSNQVWKQFAHFDFSRTVEPPSLWMHFAIRTFPTLRTG